MRIKMLRTAAGPDGVFHAGAVREIDKKIGDQMVAAGYAELVETKTAKKQPPESETADRSLPAETTAKPPTRQRKWPRK